MEEDIVIEKQPEGSQTKKKIYVIVILVVLLVLSDQLLKIFIPNFIQNGTKEIIPNLFNLTYAKNTGGAFSFAQNNLFVIVLTNIVILGIAIKFISAQISRVDVVTRISLCMIIAGGMGNLIDRVFRGFVIDYLDFTPLISFPIFNLADIYVVIRMGNVCYINNKNM